MYGPSRTLVWYFPVQTSRLVKSAKGFLEFFRDIMKKIIVSVNDVDLGNYSKE